MSDDDLSTGHLHSLLDTVTEMAQGGAVAVDRHSRVNRDCITFRRDDNSRKSVPVVCNGESIERWRHHASWLLDVFHKFDDHKLSAETVVADSIRKGLDIYGGLVQVAPNTYLRDVVRMQLQVEQDNQEKPERVALGLRSGFSRLARAALGDTTECGAFERTRDHLSELGVDATDDDGEFIGLVDVLAQLGGASSKELAAIFGRRAAPVMESALFTEVVQWARDEREGASDGGCELTFRAAADGVDGDGDVVELGGMYFDEEAKKELPETGRLRWSLVNEDDAPEMPELSELYDYVDEQLLSAPSPFTLHDDPSPSNPFTLDDCETVKTDDQLLAADLEPGDTVPEGLELTQDHQEVRGDGVYINNTTDGRLATAWRGNREIVHVLKPGEAANLSAVHAPSLPAGQIATIQVPPPSALDDRDEADDEGGETHSVSEVVRRAVDESRRAQRISDSRTSSSDTEPCPDCDGGEVQLLTSTVECERCDGTGEVES